MTANTINKRDKPNTTTRTYQSRKARSPTQTEECPSALRRAFRVISYSPDLTSAKPPDPRLAHALHERVDVAEHAAEDFLLLFHGARATVTRDATQSASARCT